jgi:preprotein translocase subunit SecG
MYILFTVLVLIVSILLILIVLVQNSKGGGLTANLSSSNQVMGARRTADFLEKATWTLAGGLLVLSLLASMTIPRSEEEQKSRLQEKAKNAMGQQEQIPTFPTEMPDVQDVENQLDTTQ